MSTRSWRVVGLPLTWVSLSKRLHSSVQRAHLQKQPEGQLEQGPAQAAVSVSADISTDITTPITAPQTHVWILESELKSGRRKSWWHDQYRANTSEEDTTDRWPCTECTFHPSGWRFRDFVEDTCSATCNSSYVSESTVKSWWEILIPESELLDLLLGCSLLPRYKNQTSSINWDTQYSNSLTNQVTYSSVEIYTGSGTSNAPFLLQNLSFQNHKYVIL